MASYVPDSVLVSLLILSMFIHVIILLNKGSFNLAGRLCRMDIEGELGFLYFLINVGRFSTYSFGVALSSIQSAAVLSLIMILLSAATLFTTVIEFRITKNFKTRVNTKQWIRTIDMIGAMIAVVHIYHVVNSLQ